MNQADLTTETHMAQAFRDHARLEAGRATDKLGVEFHSRIAKGLDILLRGAVEHHGGGDFVVNGDSDRSYDIAIWQCSCPDGSRAPVLPDGKIGCKHVFAALLWVKALKAMQKDVDEERAREAAPTLPEAPASANCFVEMHGRRVQITLRDIDEDRLIARMDHLMARYPVQGPADGQLDTSSQQGLTAARSAKAAANGSRKVSELTEIECDTPGCSAFYWRNWGKDGRSWLSHRTESGEWHKPSRNASKNAPF